MWKYVLKKMIKQKEATFFIVMIILSFAVSTAAPYWVVVGILFLAIFQIDTTYPLSTPNEPEVA